MNFYKKTVLLEAGMQEQLLEPLPRFLERLGLAEEPLGVFSRFEDSFLKTGSWPTVQKKIQRSKKAWGED